MPSYIVAIDHPSLLSLVEPFVDEFRQESRRFGRVEAANPKPFPSLVRKVTDPARLRFGIMTHDGLVGMASLADDGEISMAISAPHRGAGLGTQLLVHVIEVAEQVGFGRVIMASSRRSRPISRLGDRLGWTAVDVAPGRLELILDLPRQQSAEHPNHDRHPPTQTGSWPVRRWQRTGGSERTNLRCATVALFSPVS